MFGLYNLFETQLILSLKVAAIWNIHWKLLFTFTYVAHFGAQFREIYQKESACQSYLSNFV